MSANNLVLTASLVFALTLGSYFVLSPIAKHETDLRLAKIGTEHANVISTTKSNVTATDTATTTKVQSGAVHN